jgi:hypothetical protein
MYVPLLISTLLEKRWGANVKPVKAKKMREMREMPQIAKMYNT